jgi:hypothetical protein
MTHPNFHRWIYLIVDPGYGEQLAALPDNAAAWVVDSPRNTPVAHRLWPQRRATVPRAELTTFRATAATPAAQLLDILGTVDEHEGDDSTGGGYAALNIIGCPPDEELKEALAELGLRVDEATENGFVARRS